jgi:hypothetical protein
MRTSEGSFRDDGTAFVSPNDIQHFLVVYDIAAGQADVQPFGTDYDAAQAAYAEYEQQTRGDLNLDVVLLSADSLETVKRTHSSYFETRSFEHLLPPGVLQPH